MLTISAITAKSAMMTVYQYLTMNRENVATLLSDRRSFLRVAMEVPRDQPTKSIKETIRINTFYLSTPLEDITIPLIVVAWSSRFAVHVWHIMWGHI